MIHHWLERERSSWIRLLLGAGSLALLIVACGPASPSTSTPAGGLAQEEEQAATQEQLEALKSELVQVRSTADELQKQFDETKRTLDVRTAMLEGLLQEAKERDELEVQKTELDQRLAAIEDVTSSLEIDRKLLIELRKDPPEEGRERILEHWRNVKSLAVQSDPSLARPVDRVISAAETFAAWAEGSYASQDQAVQAYYASGADQYSQRVEELNKAALLVVIFRLDGVIQRVSG